jgi:hypothetical protein
MKYLLYTQCVAHPFTSNKVLEAAYLLHHWLELSERSENPE